MRVYEHADYEMRIKDLAVNWCIRYLADDGLFGTQLVGNAITGLPDSGTQLAHFHARNANNMDGV